MYRIRYPREGERVTMFNNGMIGTVVVLRDKYTVTVQWDDGSRSVVYVSDLGALIPGNDDGYFDAPAGYFAGT